MMRLTKVKCVVKTQKDESGRVSMAFVKVPNNSGDKDFAEIKIITSDETLIEKVKDNSGETYQIYFDIIPDSELNYEEMMFQGSKEINCG